MLKALIDKVVKENIRKGSSDYFTLTYCYGEWSCEIHPQPCSFSGIGKTPEKAIKQALQALEKLR